MFYFDDKTFISLCKQLRKELDILGEYSFDNAHDLRLAYQKFELFLTVITIAGNEKTLIIRQIPASTLPLS